MVSLEFTWILLLSPNLFRRIRILTLCGLSELLKILVTNIPSHSGGFDFVFCSKIATNARDSLPASLNSFTEKQSAFLENMWRKFFHNFLLIKKYCKELF